VQTGNGFGSGFGNQESVLELDSNLRLLNLWAPANWQQLDSLDSDLGSAEPLLLPGGLVFAIGKAGVGDLLSTSQLGGIGASPLYQAQVCGPGHGSYGGAAFYAGVIYVACSDGLRALTLNGSAKTFSPVQGWQVNSAAVGPPIISAGLVWTTGWSSQQLFGLDLGTGHAVVDQSTPVMMHFSSPSASNGKLFLATGRTVEAYTIAQVPASSTSASRATSSAPRSARRRRNSAHGHSAGDSQYGQSAGDTMYGSSIAQP
jgi:polyvinyl alcohol dehydrogenase (cytochrome)